MLQTRNPGNGASPTFQKKNRHPYLDGNGMRASVKKRMLSTPACPTDVLLALCRYRGFEMAEADWGSRTFLSSVLKNGPCGVLVMSVRELQLSDSRGMTQ